VLRIPKEAHPRQKFPLLHLEWETQSGGKKRKLKLILGPVLGLIVLALVSGGWREALALAKRYFVP
jgi:hypothetical protein